MRLGRTALADRELDDLREPVGDGDGEGGEEERRHPPPGDGEHGCQRDPDETVGADPREPDERVVERLPPVVDDPPFQVFVPAGQETP